MGLHDLTSRVGGGGHEGGDLAEVEEHQGPMAASQGLECAVREATNLVEVAEDGEPGWGRWEMEVFLGRVEEDACKEEKDR